MDKSDYEKKANHILGKPPFKLLKKDPTRRNEKRVNETLKTLLEAEDITKATQDNLRISEKGTSTPRFYGSAKLHKKDVPFRPIVSTVGSATYKIAKRMNRILAPYARGASHIENTAAFVEEVENVIIEEDEVMVSFDAKSLFTSVPIDDAYTVIEEFVRADTGVKERTGMEANAVLKLLKLCMSITNFRFRDRHYELTDGLPMGSESIVNLSADETQSLVPLRRRRLRYRQKIAPYEPA